MEGLNELSYGESVSSVYNGNRISLNSLVRQRESEEKCMNTTY